MVPDPFRVRALAMIVADMLHESLDGVVTVSAIDSSADAESADELSASSIHEHHDVSFEDVVSECGKIAEYELEVFADATHIANRTAVLQLCLLLRALSRCHVNYRFVKGTGYVERQN